MKISLICVISGEVLRMRVSYQQVSRHKHKKHHGDHAIHGKKCRVQFAEIV